MSSGLGGLQGGYSGVTKRSRGWELTDFPEKTLRRRTVQCYQRYEVVGECRISRKKHLVTLELAPVASLLIPHCIKLSDPSAMTRPLYYAILCTREIIVNNFLPTCHG